MEGRYNVRVFINKPTAATPGEEPSGQVQARVRWKKNEVCFTVGCYAQPSKWNAAGQCAMKQTVHYHNGRPSTAASINKLISNLTNSINICFTKFFIDNKIPSTIELKNAVYNHLCSDEKTLRERKKKAGIEFSNIRVGKSIYEYFHEFLDEGYRVHFWSDDVVEKVAALINHWKEIDPKQKLHLKDITVETMQKFQSNLVNRGLRNSTSAKWIKMSQCLYHCI